MGGGGGGTSQLRLNSGKQVTRARPAVPHVRVRRLARSLSNGLTRPSSFDACGLGASLAAPSALSVTAGRARACVRRFADCHCVEPGRLTD